MINLIREAIGHYIDVFKKYNVFIGRSGRSEFWYFVILNLFFIWIISIILDELTNLSLDATVSLVLLCFIGILLPSIAVLIRRLHDANYSGWLSMVVFIPVIGWIILFIILLIPGSKTENQYGQNPKGAVIG